MERVLITGGQGFFGAWIARRLLGEGISCVALDLEPNDGILRQVLEPSELARLERVEADVRDVERMASLVAELGVTHVIHLAGLQVPACRMDPARGAAVNVIGTLAVLEAARRSSGRVRCVVSASSAAVAGPPSDYEGAIPDDARHRPRTAYGVFKTAGEGCARIFWEDHGVPSVSLRPLTVYGVGREIGITSGPTLAIRAAVLARDYAIPFTGRTGFNYVEDVAKIFVECARRHREGALALNLPGEKHRVEEFLECLREVVPDGRSRLGAEGDELPVAWDFEETGLRALLGEVPHTPLREGVRRTAERFRELRERGIL